MSSTNSAKVEEEGQIPNVSPRELVLACTFVVELCEMRVWMKPHMRWNYSYSLPPDTAEVPRRKDEKGYEKSNTDRNVLSRK